ncbi:MAG: asparaginase domain-containing protein [Tissierellia bacterium]|nr:asparaginase domain-containing protein [Tissierellia bacterium]
MDKILVIETGGTFATQSVGGVRSLDHKGKTIYDYQVVNERLYRYDFEFEIVRPIYTLSENMTFEKLNILISEMENIDYNKYKGIIITHGTDTMAYTANLLSMLFSDKSIPIVLVGSNHPLGIRNSNGITNFLAALDFIANCGLQGVYVIYKDYKDTIEVHLGSRIKQMNQIIDSYESFKNLNFGVLEDGKFFKSLDRFNPTVELVKENKNPYGTGFRMNKRVLLITPYVGLRYDYFNLKEDVDAIVCGVYHSGTVNSEDVYLDNSINTLIEQAEKLDIPIFLGELTSGIDPYESVRDIENSPVVYPIYDLSLENLYVKVNLGLNKFDDRKKLLKYINDSIFFEKIEVLK